MGAGLNAITVLAGREAAEEVTRTFTLAFADRIAAEVEGVAAAVPLISSSFIPPPGPASWILWRHWPTSDFLEGAQRGGFGFQSAPMRAEVVLEPVGLTSHGSIFALFSRYCVAKMLTQPSYAPLLPPCIGKKSSKIASKP